MEQFHFSNVPEKEQQMNEFETSLIAPEGLGYGSGSISREKYTSEQENIATLDELLASGEILVPVSRHPDGTMLDDDGCGDGRGVSRIMVKKDGDIIEKASSLHRAKVFGGGPAMAGAALVATGDSQPKDATQMLVSGIDSLKHNMVDFGAHTDDHAAAPKSGCGAIDNCPAIMRNAVTFREEIAATIENLGVPTENLDSVFDRFTLAADQISEKEYAGKNVIKEIVESEKIVKELAGEHKEVAVVLNDVAGYTVDQEKVRSSADGLQTFAVDVWRLQDIATRLYPNSEEKQLVALHGMLVYTLATAATLTSGDLPVYRISPQEALQAA